MLSVSLCVLWAISISCGEMSLQALCPFLRDCLSFIIDFLTFFFFLYWGHGLAMQALYYLSLIPSPLSFSNFWDRVSIYAQAGRDHAVLFGLLYVAGLTGILHHTEPLVEMESWKLFCPGLPWTLPIPWFPPLKKLELQSWVTETHRIFSKLKQNCRCQALFPDELGEVSELSVS